MAYILGESVDEAFAVGTATGQTFTRTASYIDNSAVTFNPTFTEVGGGFYRYTYTPTQEGSHSWVGTATNGSSVVLNFEVDPVTTTAGTFEAVDEALPYLGTTGLTFSRTASYIDNAPVTWNPTFSEIGSGFYKYTYTPTTSGSHSWVGTSSAGDEVVINFEVDETTSGSVVVISSASAGALLITRAELRARIARELGDYVLLTTTALGTTTTLIDTLNVGSHAENYNGRRLWFTNGVNDGLEARVTATTDGTGTLTFTPALSAVQASTTVEVFNKRGTGFLPAQYHAAINDAINDAYPLGLIKVEATIADAFDADTQTITVPSAITHVKDVLVEDSNDVWHHIPRASQKNRYGWIPEPTAGTIRIAGQPGLDADGLTVKLIGFGRQDTLSADTDECALMVEWVVCRAKYHLCMGALDRGPEFGQKANVYLTESQRLRTRIRTNKSGAAAVRAA